MITILGRHRVRRGNVMDGLAELMGSDRAAIMYSDPPWGSGNIKYWTTINRKQTGEDVAPANLEAFLATIFGIAQTYVTDYVLIEYGVRWAGTIERHAKAVGLRSCGRVSTLYRAGKQMLPLDLHMLSKGRDYPQGFADGVQGSYGYATVKGAIGSLVPLVTPGAVLLDPCCGLGYCAKAAVDFDLAFRGNELNAARLARTIARLQ